MGSRFDEIARVLASGMSRRQALWRIGGIFGGAALGLAGLNGRASADTVKHCNDYCHDRYREESDRKICRQKCLKAPSADSLCGTTAASLTTCASGQTCCSDNCVNTGADPNNCGACGTVCNAGQTCSNGTCVAVATCTDMVKNGTETDVDCGGTACPPCADGKRCLVQSDCQSGVCSNGVCQVATCTDGVKNGAETDVDCGGPVCSKCGSGKNCQVNRDCQSGICSNGRCA